MVCIGRFLVIDLADIKKPQHGDLTAIELWDRTIRDCDNEYEHLTHNLLWYRSRVVPVYVLVFFPVSHIIPPI